MDARAYRPEIAQGIFNILNAVVSGSRFRGSTGGGVPSTGGSRPGGTILRLAPWREAGKRIKDGRRGTGAVGSNHGRLNRFRRIPVRRVKRVENHPLSRSGTPVTFLLN